MVPLKSIYSLIFLEFSGIHPFPLIHLSISKFHCCCIKFLTEHEVLSHTLEVPGSVFMVNSLLQSHFSLPQGSSFPPVCQNKQMLLVLVLSAWSPARSSNSSLCCLVLHNKLLLCLFSEGTLLLMGCRNGNMRINSVDVNRCSLASESCAG